MTIQYEGKGLYNLMIGNRSILLEQGDIDEIQSFDFISMKPDDNIEYLKETINDLKYTIEDITWEVGKLADEIRDEEVTIEEALVALDKLSRR